MRNQEIKKIRSKVINFLGIKKLPDCKIKIDKSLEKRVAFNKKIGKKYIITISPDNPNGLRHELIHLALKQFIYSGLKINLPVPQKYEKENKKTRFMEYLTICLEIKMGSKEKIKENLNNYQEYGFSEINKFYKITDGYFNNRINQKLINKIIKSINWKNEII